MNNFGKILSAINFIVMTFISAIVSFIFLVEVPDIVRKYNELGATSLPLPTSLAYSFYEFIANFSFGGSIGVAYILLLVVASIINLVISFFVGRFLQDYSLGRSIIYFVIIDGLMIILSVICVFMSVYLPISSLGGIV